MDSFPKNDAFLFHWQSGIIAEQGELPAKDIHRWLPDGRDNQQMLSLYPYAIAYIHKVLPWFSLYHIQLYLPVLCFTLGLVCYFFSWRGRTVSCLPSSWVCFLLPYPAALNVVPQGW